MRVVPHEKCAVCQTGCLNAVDTEYLLTSVHQLLTSFLRLGNLVLQQAGAQKSELPRIPPPISISRALIDWFVEQQRGGKALEKRDWRLGG